MTEEENKKHNTNFYSMEEVERTLEATKVFEDGEELYYFIGALRYLYDSNKRQQKEIEEVRQANKRLFEMGKDKAMTKLTNEIIENDYISKDKIRDKILELTGIKGELEEKDFGIGFTLDNYYKEITIKIKAYKELLEEE